jgi:hypothetical protein
MGKKSSEKGGTSKTVYEGGQIPLSFFGGVTRVPAAW